MVQEQPPVRIIKRYQNRKLYDTINSCYVTLEEIAQMIREGEDVRIQENRTGKDLTSVTLTQIIFEEEKKHKSLLPLSTLKNIIQSGGESIVDFVQKSLTTGVSSISHVGNNVRGEAGRVIDKIRDEFEDGGNLIKDFLGRTNKSIDDLQHKVEERFRHPFGSNKPVIKLPNLKTEIRGLRKKLASLERQLRNYKDPE